jgi:hypothetical protein
MLSGSAKIRNVERTNAKVLLTCTNAEENKPQVAVLGLIGNVQINLKPLLIASSASSPR